ncbi:hypothetical protein ONE63_004635 [Megalurothrips usitatus]|uniref:Uncharacterized protein n=1 Tax=Megalurothrips usitatus TaxID=439358 RepID=A0AAV7X4H7_9NEOP|nr:hypothetical protein ONE63_004635 [Megalurothrips usitatus]
MPVADGIISEGARLFPTKMVPKQCSLHVTVLVLVYVFFNAVPCSESTDSRGSNQDPYYNAFISSRMKHLTAINDMKQMKNSVKRHQLIVDLCKEIFKVLDESRKLLATMHLDNVALFSLYADVVDYLENTAFFCDLLVFFPEVTAKLIEKNLLWRITLIDSIQEAMSFNVEFIDENTRTQLESAYKILSEGVEISEPKIEKKEKEVKKPRRGPRLTSNEL